MRIEVTAGWVSWANTYLPSPLGIPTLVKGIKPTIVAFITGEGIQ